MGNNLKKSEQSQTEEEEKYSELEEEPADSDFTCEICIEPVEAKNKFKNSGKCKHNFCTDCIGKYIEAKIVEFNMANISCPALDCKFQLDPLSSRPVLRKQMFDQWCELLCLETILTKYDLSKRCYCPCRNCSTLVLNECNDNKPTKSECPNCKENFCFQCRGPWHAGYRCSENPIERSPDDILFGKLIEENKWTRCPSCGHAVERTRGCPEIWCRCGHRFCHVCGAEESHCKCSPSLEEIRCYCGIFLVLIPAAVFIIIGFRLVI